MMQNLVAMEITQEEEDEVNALFARIDAILKGGISLDVDTRQALTKMGAKSEFFVRGNLDLANQNAGLIPRDIDLAAANADLQARERMLRISARSRQLTEKLEDTTLALGSDLMVVAQLLYGILKMLGKGNNLDEAVKDLGYRFARRKKKPEPEKE